MIESNKATVTFVDDDNFKEFLRIQKPVFDKYGVKTTLAIVPNVVEAKGHLTKNELHQLQDEGFDIVSHTFTHSPEIFKYSNDLSKISDEQVVDEFKKSRNWLKENGFKGYNTIVYPWGDYREQTSRYHALASKFYEFGIHSLAHDRTRNNMKLNRLFLNKNTPIKNYKKAVNKTIKKQGWFIIGTHSIEDQVSSEYLDEFINYLKSANVDILPFSEACHLDFKYIYHERKSLIERLKLFIKLRILKR